MNKRAILIFVIGISIAAISISVSLPYWLTLHKNLITLEQEVDEYKSERLEYERQGVRLMMRTTMGIIYFTIGSILLIFLTRLQKVCIVISKIQQRLQHSNNKFKKFLLIK
ncbi:MAG: hypothetical protein LBV04_05995 [Deferribacteraceae bacterium]|jgi:hypothetical protein|nr:hypothetical protein [Deferribacteraceae bacterium]